MDVGERFRTVNVDRSHGPRAPHKPLLLLLMIARYVNGDERLVSFTEIEKPLENLLIEFGPHRKSYHPEQPFWHLYNDGIWDLDGVDPPAPGSSRRTPGKTKLREAVGGIKSEIFEQLHDETTVRSAVSSLLNGHFPDSIHTDILRAVGLDIGYTVRRASRDHRFRENVLRAYHYECAVCGFTSRLGRNLVGLEAAHIKWHTVGGPDSEANGVALCALHHKLFDRGIFTIADDMMIVVSESANGSAMFDHVMSDFHGRELRTPQRTAYLPEPNFLAWHVREVFHPPAREVRSA